MRTYYEQRRRIAGHVAAVALTAACATAGGHLQIEGRIALRAVELQRGMQAVLEAADAANQAGVLADADLVTVAEIGRTVGFEGQRLAQVLQDIDNAREPVSEAIGIGRAQIIVQTIQSALTGFPEAPPAVLGALTAVHATLVVLATELQGGGG